MADNKETQTTNESIEENEEDIELIPLADRWAEDDMAGVIVHDSVDSYKKKAASSTRSSRIKRQQPDTRTIRINPSK